MSGQTPVRLPLTKRQADALAKVLEYLVDDAPMLNEDEFAAAREVAGKLDTLREQ